MVVKATLLFVGFRFPFEHFVNIAGCFCVFVVLDGGVTHRLNLIAFVKAHLVITFHF